MIIRKRLTRAVVAASVTGVTLFASAGIATAQSPDPCAPLNESVPTYKVTNVKNSHSFDNFEHGSEWRVRGEGPGKLTLSRTVAASNTFSVALEVPTSVLSGAVGFDVTEEVSYAASYEVDIPAGPPGHNWFIEAGTRDDVYVYDVQRFCQGFPQGEPARGRAKKTGHLIYQSWEEEPGNPRE